MIFSPDRPTTYETRERMISQTLVLRSKIVLVALTIFVLHGCGAGPPDNSYQAPPPPEVNVAKPIVRDVTQFVEENGETEAVERADVRARVQGVLEEILFEPRAKIKKEVEKGEVLYLIEPKEFEAAVQAAEASVAGSKAALQVANAQVEIAEVEITRAELDYKRFKDLFDKGAGTEQELDESKAAIDAAMATKKGMDANVKTAEAEQKKAEANLVQVNLDLDYTTVRAPISGVVTKTEVKVGNLVENGTLLTSVVDRSRMYANFNISDREALRLQEARRAKRDPDQPDDSDLPDYPAYLRRSNDSGFPFEGLVDYIDQEGIDQSTGTLAIRCVFENPDDLLFPGLFVYVRIPVGELKDALLIPERALFRDQTGSFVLTVNDEKKIERNPVTVGQTADGMVVIKEGLSPEDWIVLEGSQRARPGVEVVPVETEISEASKADKQSSKVEETGGDPSASNE